MGKTEALRPCVSLDPSPWLVRYVLSDSFNTVGGVCVWSALSAPGEGGADCTSALGTRLLACCQTGVDLATWTLLPPAGHHELSS